jgi:hypothetical protein
LSKQKCFFFIIFHIFVLALFLVKRHKTFNVVLVFKSFFFGLAILFIWFWVLVKCKKWFIFCIWFWIFYIHFTLYWLIAWLASPFLFGPLFYSVSPFYSVIKDQIYFYLSSIRSCLLLLLLLTASSRPR